MKKKKKDRSKNVDELVEKCKKDPPTRADLEKMSEAEKIRLILGLYNQQAQLSKTIDRLTKDLDKKKKKVEELKRKNEDLQKTNDELSRQVANAANYRFGPRTEKSSRRNKNKQSKENKSPETSNTMNTEDEQDQSACMSEDEQDQSACTSEDEQDQSACTSEDEQDQSACTPEDEQDQSACTSENQQDHHPDNQKKKGVRHTKHDKDRERNLRTIKRYLKDEGEFYCPKCGALMIPMAMRCVKREKEIIPAETVIVEYYVTCYYCPCCKKASESTIYCEEAPFVPIPGTTATSAMLLAWIIMMKFVYHLPYTRIQSMLRMSGDYRTTESMMSRHIIMVTERYFMQVCNYLLLKLREREVVGSDDTTLLVMNEDSKENTSISRIFVYTTVPGADRPIKIFVYAPDRRGIRIRDALGEDYAGSVVADCYSGYNILEEAILAYCWLHMRREFLEAVPENMKNRVDGIICDEIVERIDKIFEEDHKLQKKYEGWNERLEARKRILGPLIDSYFERIKSIKTENPAVQKAINYAVNHEEGFRQVLKNPDIPLSNNVSERMARRVVLGRKNWLFAGSPWGAMAIGNCQTLIMTAEANGLDPFLYIQYLLTVMPQSRRGEENYEFSEEELEQLMPWNADVACHCTPRADGKIPVGEMGRCIAQMNGFEDCDDPQAEFEKRKIQAKMKLAAQKSGENLQNSDISKSEAIIPDFSSWNNPCQYTG